MEEWRIIPGYTTCEVSSLGRVRHAKHKRIRKLRIRRDGYAELTIRSDALKKRKTIKVHRLIAAAFFPGSEKTIVDHINKIRSDNRVSNLRISTYSLNNNNKSFGLESTVRRIITLHERGVKADQIAALLVD